MNRTLIAILVCLSLCPGCKSTAPTTRPTLYDGPTLPIDAVIAHINANNSKIPTLYAQQNFEANIVDEKKQTHFVNGFGNLLYTSPSNMRLTARKELDYIFDMGANADQFWLHVIPDPQVVYWGNTKNIGKPCMREIPIRPDLILQVLGVNQIDIDLTRDPVPVMRFNNDADAYMLVWQTRSADRWLAQKEIWYDRVTYRPSVVLLFDSTGRVVLRAWLSDYQQIEADNVDKKDWPFMATHYNLFFPDSGTHMSFTLSDMTLSHNGFPKAISYLMPDMAALKSNDIKVIQIDEDCGS